MRTRSASRAGTHAAVRRIASVLLCYPDERLEADLPVIRDVVAALPEGPEATHLRAFLGHVDTVGRDALAAEYVEVFDLRRRCCLYLTYYADGDTRRRGMSLARLKLRYRDAGLVPEEGELPDFLPVVLEYAAEAPEDGQALLSSYRPALELLQLALEDAGSAYRDVVLAVTATLPGASAADREAVLALARQGPPQEDVGVDGLPGGLDPYTIDPTLVTAPSCGDGHFVPLSTVPPTVPTTVPTTALSHPNGG